MKRVFGTITILLVVLLAGGFAWLWFAPCWLGGCAPVEEMVQYQAEGSQLLDVDGEPFGTLATVNRRIVSIDSLPPHVPRAFVAIEDQRFYDHGGVDFRRVAGALVENVQAGGIEEGGSTITMQLARNLFPEWLPYTEQSLRRKLLEVRVARQIERTFSKEKILNLYLNHIYLGAGAYGVEAAARTYFGKPARELSVAEAATLAALPKAPSTLSPRENPEGARERRNLVLEAMAETGFISPTEAEAAQEEPLQLAEGGGEEAPQLEGSYFVERVRREMQELVGHRFYTAGLKIYTTLDPTAQRAAEEELAQQLDRIEAGGYGTYRHETYPEAKGGAESGETPYLQGAVVVMDASTGAVRALVGGRDFSDSKFDRATQALRQPGSAFKPFVYLTALERYGSPVHTVLDAPFRLTFAGGQVWTPKNYTGRYEGEMTLREALTHSKNVPTARLAQELGIPAVIRNAHALGITAEIPAVPATALGAAAVRPIELVGAYAAFANGGMRVDPHFIRRIENRHGRVVWEAPTEREQVIEPAAAFVLTDILRGVVDRGTGTAVRAAGFRGPAAGKTGTTNDATDVWFVGYTPDLVGGVWMGMDDPQTIVEGASGGALAAPVWGRIMRRIYADRPTPAPWSPPPGVATAEVERGTGRVVGDLCPAQGPTYTEYFTGIPPRQPCRTGVPRPSIAGGDTQWANERDTATSPSEIDWPELEEIRERNEGEPEPLRSPTLSPPPVAQPQSERESADRGAPPTDSARPEPEVQEPEQEGPELLGVPVRRGTDPTPAPPDTLRP